MSDKLGIINYKLLKQSFLPVRWRGICLVFVFLFLLFATNLYSQKITASVNRNTIRLGEPFDLTLKVEPTSNAPLSIDSWFDVPDSLANFQVASRGAIDTLSIASTNSYSQVITLTSFDSGTHPLPAFTVNVGGRQLQSQPISITVIPVDVSGMTDYHDIKDIIEPEPEKDNAFWMVIAFIIVAIIAVGLIWWKRAKKKIRIPITQNHSIDVVLKQLNALQSVYQSNKYQQFYTELIALCKGFADHQLQITTISKTTEEYILILNGKLKDKKLLEQYTHLLHLAEKVKFAKATPTTAECKQSMQDAKAFITQLHSSPDKPVAHV